MGFSGFKKALVVIGFSAFSSMASADFIQTFRRATIALACSARALRTARFRQISIRMNRRSSSSSTSTTTAPWTTEINSGLFPTIDGSEFSFDFTGEGATGTWTYNPGAGDPGINFFVAKGGPGFNLFSNLGDPLTDDWFTPDNPGGNPAGLSHLSFYDTDGNGVPEPTTLLLLGAGLFAAGFVRRRVKRD